MFWIVDFNEAARKLTAANRFSAFVNNRLAAANDGKRQELAHSAVCCLLLCVVVGAQNWVDGNSVYVQILSNLVRKVKRAVIQQSAQLTRALNSLRSSSVIESDLAMTGMMLTRFCSFFINSMSNGLRLCSFVFGC